MVGMLVGAGIFQVTGDASRLTGPSVILGYGLLSLALLATSVPYAVFLSTPLGDEPGGEYLHVSRTFGVNRASFLVGWFKLVSYIGAGSYLAHALANYLVAFDEIVGGEGGLLGLAGARRVLALLGWSFFLGLHVVGVRWFGRVQVAMCALLGVSILVFVLPGLTAVRAENYQPFFTGGAPGFLQSLIPIFFAYAGFEAIANAGGEVKDSRRLLPRVFLRGIVATTIVFVAITVVAFGVLPAAQLERESAPIAAVAAVYLPSWGAAFVALGGVLAVATSLNATVFVPSRLAILMAEDGFLPRFLGRVDPRTGTPLLGLGTTWVLGLLLLWTGQFFLLLQVAVFALLCVYFANSLALLFFPKQQPELWRAAETRLPPGVQRAAAWVSVACLGTMLAVQLLGDFGAALEGTPWTRWRSGELLVVELALAWAAVGLGVGLLGRRRAA